MSAIYNSRQFSGEPYRPGTEHHLGPQNMLLSNNHYYYIAQPITFVNFFCHPISGFLTMASSDATLFMACQKRLLSNRCHLTGNISNWLRLQQCLVIAALAGDCSSVSFCCNISHKKLTLKKTSVLTFFCSPSPRLN